MIEGHEWAELSEGDEFAGYRIERRLGRGGMGILYLAVEPGLDRHVALKLIAPEAAADDVFARRFTEESRIAASIEHPNVVPIYAAGEQGGIPFIAMRFVSGSDLGRRIARAGKLDPERAVALIAQIGNGLDAIHAAGLVHRDVKPANVLLSGEEGAEHAYITDFGVARNVATQSGLTQTGRFVGTLDYVAPEQISGGPIDARVDVYALGCLLYKLLTGEVPFPREGEAARLYAHLNDPPPPPSLYVPEVPMALDDVVVRAMSKPPEDRYPSAGDLGRAALAALSGTEISVPERTVATGAAATVESVIVPPAGGQATVSETRPSGVQAATEATRKLEGEDGAPPDAVRRRRLLLGGGLAALAAAVVAVVVLASGGGGGGGTTAADSAVAQARLEKEHEVQKEQAEARKKKREEEEQPLTQAQLTGQGDAICERSKEEFVASGEKFPGGEEEANVPYSKELVANSTKATRELEGLNPPANLKAPYENFMALQRAVVSLDRQALAAANAGDVSAYLTARETRDEMKPERQAVGEEVGFSVCGIPGG
jgi:hypothetical protein